MSVQKSDKKINVGVLDFCHKWIIKDSVKYILVRGAEVDEDGSIPLEQLADNECLFAPGGIYVREEDLTTQK